jgi:hypothetical protein
VSHPGAPSCDPKAVSTNPTDTVGFIYNKAFPPRKQPINTKELKHVTNWPAICITIADFH